MILVGIFTEQLMKIKYLQLISQIETDMFIPKSHGGKAIKKAVNTPIEIIHDDGTRTVVGVVQKVQLG